MSSCHVNMLKAHISHGDVAASPSASPIVVASPTVVSSVVASVSSVSPSVYTAESDGLHETTAPCARVKNCLLKNLPAQLQHLTPSAQADMVQVINRYLPLFSETPSHTTFLSHDIDVGCQPLC